MATDPRTAYQLQIGGNANTVVRSFRSAVDHIARAVAPDEDERRRWGRMGGSYAQKVRYACDGRFEILAVVEHDLDAEPGFETAGFHLDLANDFDPGYALQRAIYLLDDGDEPIDEIAADLEAAVRAGIAGVRSYFGDEKALERLRRIELLMEGETVIPVTGTASEALDRIPEIVVRRFDAHAERFRPAAPAR